jgi:hypothetical protein
MAMCMYADVNKTVHFVCSRPTERDSENVSGSTRVRQLPRDQLRAAAGLPPAQCCHVSTLCKGLFARTMKTLLRDVARHN